MFMIVLDHLNNDLWEERFVQILPPELRDCVTYLELEMQKRNCSREEALEVIRDLKKDRRTYNGYPMTSEECYERPMRYVAKVAFRLQDEDVSLLLVDPKLRGDDDYESMMSVFIERFGADRILFWDDAIKMFMEELSAEST